MRHFGTEDQSRGQAAALGPGWAQGQPQERAFLFRVSPASLPIYILEGDRGCGCPPLWKAESGRTEGTLPALLRDLARRQRDCDNSAVRMSPRIWGDSSRIPRILSLIRIQVRPARESDNSVTLG